MSAVNALMPIHPSRWLTLAVRLRLMYDIAYYLARIFLLHGERVYIWRIKMKNRGISMVYEGWLNNAS